MPCSNAVGLCCRCFCGQQVKHLKASEGAGPAQYVDFSFSCPKHRRPLNWRSMQRSIRLSVFCGISVDGFLARLDHTLDFLETGGQEPHGYDEFMSSVDIVVIGRNTYN